ncbi:MAG TPA: hypothetical protein VFY87_09845 [Geminicoccaceae bacterium]|nr:hypothetical protein [Geminicoccaceae bacterium]
MQPFAVDQGCAGPPFAWDEEERLHLRARFFFLLHGLDRTSADYVLGVSPSWRRREGAAFDGRFRSRDLIPASMAAFEAGRPLAGSLHECESARPHLSALASLGLSSRRDAPPPSGRLARDADRPVDPTLTAMLGRGSV